jgi:hypothetical protein
MKNKTIYFHTDFLAVFKKTLKNWGRDTQLNDSQLKGTQQNGCQYNCTQHKDF